MSCSVVCCLDRVLGLWYIVQPYIYGTLYKIHVYGILRKTHAYGVLYKMYVYGTLCKIHVYCTVYKMHVYGILYKSIKSMCMLYCIKYMFYGTLYNMYRHMLRFWVRGMTHLCVGCAETGPLRCFGCCAVRSCCHFSAGAPSHRPVMQRNFPKSIFRVVGGDS